MSTILRTEHLCKYYHSGENEVRAVDDCNIAIAQGEFVAVVGKSGSGKSTLLHMLGGLDNPTSGKVYVGDTEIFSLKPDALAVFRRRKMGFIFQAYNLVSSINVWENIVLPIGLDGRKADESFVQDIIQTLGLEGKRHNLPNTLSGGHCAGAGSKTGYCLCRRTDGQSGFQDERRGYRTHEAVGAEIRTDAGNDNA